MKSFSILSLRLSCYPTVFMPTAVTSIVLCRLVTVVVSNAFQPAAAILHWRAKLHIEIHTIPYSPRKSLVLSSKAQNKSREESSLKTQSQKSNRS